MKTANYSYVSAPISLKKAIEAVKESVSQTECYFSENGGIDEYCRCLKNGTTYKRDEVLAECRQWLKESKAPSYMHQPALQNAYNSLGDSLNRWIDGLPNYVPVRYTINGQTKEVDVADIVVTPDGWQPSERLLAELTATCTRTLTDEEMQDIRTAEQIAELYATLATKGYDIDVATFAQYTEPEQRAEAFCNSYNALQDYRVSEEDKAEIKREQQMFYCRC